MRLNKIKRISINLILIIGLVFSILLTIKAYCIGEWNTIAGSLAVITALIATFLSLRVIWKQEDEYEPEITVSFDVDSRSGIIQLLIQNIGGSNAYDIKIEWNKTLKDAYNKELFLPYIPILTKGDSIRLIVDSTMQRYEKTKSENTELIYNGYVKFKYSKKDKEYIKEEFEISLEHFKNKIRPITDEQEFHLKNSKLTENIKEINKTLQNLVEKLENRK